MGFKLNLKWGSQLYYYSSSPYHLPNSSHSYWPLSSSNSSSSRSRETSYQRSRASFAFLNSWQREGLYNDPLKAHKCSTAVQTVENDYSEMEETKMNTGKRSHGGLHTMPDDSIMMPPGEDKLSFVTSLQSSRASRFALLMESLDNLEATFTDSDAVRLERDILAQLERLGALKLFHTCLSRTMKSPSSFYFSDSPTQLIGEPLMTDTMDVHMSKIVVHSGKKEERKSRRKKALEKASGLALPSITDLRPSNFSCRKRASNARCRRLQIARNEAEMSKGVKMVENLERIRTVLEEETGQVVSLSSWAEAAGIDETILQQHLHFGWHCKDEIIRSTRPLVIYLARNYRGLGVALDDLIQAGNFGIMQGAVRFDHTRGYRFSTYIQHWIRKSMSTLVARHARGIRIPFTLNKAINQIQNARKALSSSQGKYPDDDEIAKFTGLSLAKITSASRCLRVVGSIDQMVGHYKSAKFMELTPDTSITSPNEAITRQHMIKDIHGLLKGLDPRERQVLVLRFGLGDHQRKSLEEIGRLFCVSKEWIRKIERKALTKLRHEESGRKLNYYL